VNVEATVNLQSHGSKITPLVELVDFKGPQATYKIEDKAYSLTLQVTGQHNFQNAAAAIALVHSLLPDTATEKLMQQLSEIRTAFGRGQAFVLPDGSNLQLALVKNPAGFRQNLASYVDADTTVMIAINDNIADSRDLSWLWDVDFSSLKHSRGVALTSGRRAVDMALRLSYDEVTVVNIEPDLRTALLAFSKLPAKKKVILASYTAMMRLHKLLEGMEKHS
jgi:lipid II isoglutaminyl synthase (glutamine-hydrolysing)